MARTIAEIKESIAADFMRNADVAHAYGFEAGAPFSSHFSRVSIESLLFYIVACATWVLANLFDQHKTEVEQHIEEVIPHRPKWYRDKALAFMKDHTLIPDTDRYDTSGMTEAEIAAAKVVKHAATEEAPDVSILILKVAGEKDGQRCKLDETTAAQLEAYIAEVKDAGVRIKLVNIDADRFNCEVDIYYDPMLQPSQVESLCREAIQDYIENLPFNGEYTNVALVDRLQAVEGVKIPELRSASAESDSSQRVPIDARYVPAAGYFVADTLTLNMFPY